MAKRTASGGSDLAKRVVDVTVATMLLLLVLPVLIVGAVGSAIALRAWPFFTQTRLGRDGREFKFLKLRTLPVHVPRYTSKYELDDVRIPRFALALRQLHLDELPQLLLVIAGKMSLVGPRPEMAYLYDRFTPEFATRRTSVRPGCTGLWQVGEHCGQMIYEHPEFDAYYVEHRSLRLDLWILARTAVMHLPGKRRLVSLDALPAWAGAGSTPAPELSVVVDDRPSLNATTIDEINTFDAIDASLDLRLEQAI